MKPEEILSIPDHLLPAFVSECFKERLKIWGNSFEFCSIINAKSGLCDRGCKFCAQAFPKKTKAPVYPLVDIETMVEGAKRAKKAQAFRYSIVTSGKGINEKELLVIVEAVKRIKQEVEIEVDVSLGIMPDEFLEELKKSGVRRIHHNLETSKEFYPKITTKIDWNEKYRFAQRVKEQNLELCCGGLFGMGETEEDWISFANALAQLEPESIPVNLLIPIPGTPLENIKPLSPLSFLKLIMYLRLKFPKAELRLCGGREYNLRETQAIAALVVNGFMVGGYLTRAGRDPSFDYQLIRDLGFNLITHPQNRQEKA